MRTYEVTYADLQDQHVAAVRGHVSRDGVGDFLGAAFGEVMGALRGQGAAPAGPPYGRYLVTEDGFDVEAGFPVHGPVQPQGRVESLTLPGGHVARTQHVGAYDQVGDAYTALAETVLRDGYEPTGQPWESYLDGPEVPEPRTLVQVPCRPVRAGHPGPA